MIVSADLARLAPKERAAMIYAEAHGNVANRLWRAALGGDTDGDGSADAIARRLRTTDAPDLDIDALVSLLTSQDTATAAPPAAVDGTAAPADRVPCVVDTTEPGRLGGLGPNGRFGDALEATARRTGIPAAALAAIVDAEAAKGCDGSWKTTSRNPRSSAAGLGQFLGSTWQSEAERAGTWLHGIALGQGWLSADGHVLPGARSALLALRYDAATAINATADYAHRSVTLLKKAGIAIGEDVTTVARAAYLGHHLGTADAVRFLKGGLGSGRARLLLDSQVGSAAASRRIASTGDAASAHRSWLLDYIDRHVTPGRFAA
ncbi:peptidoglycan-binding protein [Sphingomonas ginsenosidivorax]|uniref:Peptidoglycan-binding protein n=1 Tax=Sphingomonas ginsenosidivorax TaxID=862135 RepID=A0A5C6U9G6_9SPHN|nr:peptidoglycan-binding protein [Sphingomonas ginsenosidivorax]TXC69647.1 peptidoglycan-binding protein [Sphingomonas ginsenosidivorax]